MFSKMDWVKLDLIFIAKIPEARQEVTMCCLSSIVSCSDLSIKLCFLDTGKRLNNKVLSWDLSSSHKDGITGCGPIVPFHPIFPL